MIDNVNKYNRTWKSSSASTRLLVWKALNVGVASLFWWAGAINASVGLSLPVLQKKSYDSRVAISNKVLKGNACLNKHCTNCLLLDALQILLTLSLWKTLQSTPPSTKINKTRVTSMQVVWKCALGLCKSPRGHWGHLPSFWFPWTKRLIGRASMAHKCHLKFCRQRHSKKWMHAMREVGGVQLGRKMSKVVILKKLPFAP